MKARSHGGGGGNRPDLFSSFPWKTHHTCVSCLEAFFSPSESKMDRSPQPRHQENRSEADLRTKETDGTRGTQREEGDKSRHLEEEANTRLFVQWGWISTILLCLSLSFQTCFMSLYSYQVKSIAFIISSVQFFLTLLTSQRLTC